MAQRYGMQMNDDLLKQAEYDLCLNGPFVKGKQVQIKNCWHFYTDGNAVDRLFDDKEDFIDGMNRIFVAKCGYKLLILAFTLMDTHLHFVIYGDFDECRRFMLKYVKLTSMHITERHSERKKLNNLPVHHQRIDNDFYLKTAICYVIKNPPVGGLHYNAYDYPWSSGALYFRETSGWTTPAWAERLGDMAECKRLSNFKARSLISFFKSKQYNLPDAAIINEIVFPGEYVAYKLVERIFKSHRSFNYFMCIAKEEDIESQGGAISKLTIPIYELRDFRNALCLELFNSQSVRGLKMEQRIKLAKVMKSKYNCSTKQIARVCGLIYEQVKDMLK